MRLIGMLSTTLRVDQAILTGESGSVVKELGRTAALKAVVQDKTCIMYSGTVVTVGRARGVVIGTGLNTAIGRIRDAMNEVADDEMSPLKRKLDEFGQLLSKVIAVICVLVWVVNIGHFRDPAHGGLVRGAIYYFKIAVALAVAAIPEGLPAVVTTCLALGTRKMAKQNAIVRSLPSVETLGCTSVICSDKTGTLTTNMMSVTRVCVVDTTMFGGGSGSPHGGGGRIAVGSAAECLTEYCVTGNTYAPEGVITEAHVGGKVVEHPADMASVLHLAICSSLCNDSTLTYNGDKHAYDKIGESTEVALRVLAEKIGLPGFDAMPSALTQLSKQERAAYCATYWEGQFSRIAALDFTRDRKLMSVLATRKGQSILFTKGAPEAVLQRCTQALTNGKGAAEPMNDAVRNALNDRLQKFARGSLRVLALAMRPMPAKQATVSPDDERDLTFLGFVGMMDPPRTEVARAIATCRSAGIRVVMVTGDNKTTAEAVASQIGLGDENFTAHLGAHPASLLARKTHEALDANGVPVTGIMFPPSKSFQGLDFDEMSELRQLEAVANMTVFSRVEPQHKSRLVELLKAQGHVVAMTGDGVNDAPALRRANIGIAMGSGTAVAKHASDMVLADDNFASIVLAVAEGRAIYNNTKQFIRYMVSSNIGEVVCIFIAAALGMPETLCPVQLLWVNLVTDGLPATALGFNKPDRDIMRQRPRRPNESIVDKWLFVRYLVVGLYVGLVTVGAFAWWYMAYAGGPGLTWTQLTSFEECVEGAHNYSCDIFGKKERRPSTMSMSVLVVVEMFNALNALSENGSLVTHPPWSNPWLVGAITISMALHCVILYVPWLATTFSVAPLTYQEWRAVLWFSFPVILVDEVLKLISRRFKGRLRFLMARGDLIPRSMSHQS
jgi:Ca2+ transporting ATPase